MFTYKNMAITFLFVRVFFISSDSFYNCPFNTILKYFIALMNGTPSLFPGANMEKHD